MFVFSRVHETRSISSFSKSGFQNLFKFEPPITPQQPQQQNSKTKRGRIITYSLNCEKTVQYVGTNDTVKTVRKNTSDQ